MDNSNNQNNPPAPSGQNDNSSLIPGSTPPLGLDSTPSAPASPFGPTDPNPTGLGQSFPPSSAGSTEEPAPSPFTQPTNSQFDAAPSQPQQPWEPMPQSAPQPMPQTNWPQPSPTDPAGSFDPASLSSNPPPAFTSSDANLTPPPTNTSSLDNPLGAPVQTPPFDPSLSAQPLSSDQPSADLSTFSPYSGQGTQAEPPPLGSTPPGSTQPDPFPMPQDTYPSSQPVGGNTSTDSYSTPSDTPPVPAEENSIPTDLSHLISGNEINNSLHMGSQPSNAAPTETIVVPSPVVPTPEMPSLPAESGHGGIPKWVIGLGVGLLIVIAGASAYFILGVGQPPKTTSLPATQTPSRVTQIPATPPPVVQPTVAPTPASASDSASFGALEGTKPTATRAADLINKPSPSPTLPSRF